MYGLLGEKLGHSFSPQIHVRLGDYGYELIEKNKDEVESFIKSMDYQGLNITIPYKQETMKYCDRVSDIANRIGCINTIVNKDNRLYGYNTDYYGMIRMFEQADIEVFGKKVLVLGEGATSNTAQVVLEDLGAKVIVKASRKGKVKFNDYGIFEDSEIILNCTPVGMFPNNLETLVELERLKNLEAVVDVIYNPLNTKLILDGKKRKLKTSDGLVMLISQALCSAELFTGKSYKSMEEEIIKDLKKQLTNIVLIGMPGSGKSSIGRILAEHTGKKFVDTDSLIEVETGQSIDTIFRNFGEEYFRKVESDIIRGVTKGTNQVISTGGGCVLKPENYYPLKQNSIIYFIDRNLEELAAMGRPLSAGGIQTLEKMYKERYPLYEKFWDAKLKNTDVETTASEVLRMFNENFKH